MDVYTSGYLKEGVRPVDVGGLSDEDYDRLMLRGANVVTSARPYPVLVPRLSREHYRDMLTVVDNLYDDEVKMLLTRLCVPGSAAWHNYMALHAAHRKPNEDGTGDYTVIRNPAPEYAPPKEKKMAKDLSTATKRVYTLAQVFTDAYVSDKYQLPVKLLRDVQLLAISRPMEAAATLKQAMQALAPEGVKVEVRAAGYARSKQQAIATIRDFAQGKSGEVAFEADVVGNTLFMYGPGHVRGGVNKRWFVQGPLKHADSVRDVMKLCEAAGLHEVMFLLSLETSELGIEIYDGENFVGPTIISHAKSTDVELPVDSDEVALASASPEVLGRIYLAYDNVRPVNGDNGLVATSVQVGPRMLLANAHINVSGEGKLYVGSDRIDLGGVPVSSDLWMHRVSAPCVPWSFRDAVIGELVTIVFHNGDKPVMSRPVRVLSTNHSMIVMERCALITPGMSGGAVVALSDGALLGLHRGATLRNLTAMVYSGTMNLDLIEMISCEDAAESAGVDNSQAIYTQIKSRGLQSAFVAVAGSLESLMDGGGEHAGTAFRQGRKLLTTCMAQEYIVPGTVSGNDAVVAFASETGFMSSAAAPMVTLGQGLAVVRRQPQLYEKVIVVVKRGDDVYFSRESVVRQIGVGKKMFYLDVTLGNQCSLLGGVVMSVQDCAVLGMFVREGYSKLSGRLYSCVPLPDRGVSAVMERVVDLNEALSSKLGALHVDSWDKEVLQKIFDLRSSSTDMEALAEVGRLRLQLALTTALLRSGLPRFEWKFYRENLLCDERVASLLSDLGLTDYVTGLEDVDVEEISQVQANVMHALLELVAVHEGDEVVSSTYQILGLVPASFGFGAKADYRRMMRRPSEVGLKSESGELLSPVD